MSLFQTFQRFGVGSCRSYTGFLLVSRQFSSFPSFDKFPSQVKIVEVGARDGLQNEKQFIETTDKIELINRLSDTGLTTIEATSFVSPKRVPQIADNKEVLSKISKKDSISYPVLVPNLRGLEDAVTAGAKEIAVFASSSEAFSQKNINCSIAESKERYEPVIKSALEQGLKVRAYLSCCLGCPFEGPIPPKQVTEISSYFLEKGCYEVSLGDTLGVGNAGTTIHLLRDVLSSIPKEQIAVHFHDTYGQALANVLIALQFGISTVDSSVSGLGGCPYAKGAKGNVATEDVVYMLRGLGIETGVDLDKLIMIGNWISGALLGRYPASRTAFALTAKKPELLQNFPLPMTNVPPM